MNTLLCFKADVAAKFHLVWSIFQQETIFKLKYQRELLLQKKMLCSIQSREEVFVATVAAVAIQLRIKRKVIFSPWVFMVPPFYLDTIHL